jgi:hypothetical protein
MPKLPAAAASYDHVTVSLALSYRIVFVVYRHLNRSVDSPPSMTPD